MNINRVIELIKYYFNFRERSNIASKEKRNYYRSLDKDDLETEYDRVKTKYRWHEGLLKLFKAVIVFIVGASFVTGLFRFTLAFGHTLPQIQHLTNEEMQTALGVLLIFIILIIASLTLGVVWYSRYVNNLRTKLESIEKIQKENEERVD
ncbi:hypothetical protein ACFO26_05950 [Lactococcus nasutitermitis]|uniref:DUF202 domain-containing protein n=1 Tax=Lactococcus nasutitermitis TaxID=1652957 RepID=A0ABV9JDQ4_9LACT|nr:hypothetical protein [Lactococcus nasutitermitis]